MSMRILMMGTGAFALPTFRALCESDHKVVGLATQPDRTGRGHHHHPHPMKEYALEQGVPVFQPDDVNLPESLSRLREFQADLFVVAAYGQILSAELLSIPPRGAFNLHASLLPKYRGAAPIQYAVWKGEEETGVSIFRIEPKLDAGPILGVVRTPIGSDETSGDLETRLAELAAPLTLQVLSQIESDTTTTVMQDISAVTRAPKLQKTRGLVNWSRTAAQIDCQIRAMQPWPMPYTFLHAEGRPVQRLLILQIRPTDGSSDLSTIAGEVLPSPPGRLFVRCGDGAVEVLRLQPAGKRAMAAEEFLRGHAVPSGARFGGEVLA
ncbi:MAG: methionyl-tRNA formyltransferase [Planctomycetaceae bacterium]|nr:methionyl-tRNA formyltransferase [Planctomycetaceae bacterium]